MDKILSPQKKNILVWNEVLSSPNGIERVTFSQNFSLCVWEDLLLCFLGRFKLKRIGDKISGGKKSHLRFRWKNGKKRSKSTSQKIRLLAQVIAVFPLCKVVWQQVSSFSFKPALFCLFPSCKPPELY